MTTTEHQSVADVKKIKATKLVLQMVVGAALGFFAMLALDRLIGIDRLLEDMASVSLVAIVMALIFAMIGLIVLTMSSNRKIFMLNQQNTEADAADFHHMRPLLFWSAICIFLYTGILILMAIANNASQGIQLTTFWGVVVLMVSQTAISWHLWNRYDELYRDVTKESCAAAFVILEFGLVIWAAAAICGLGATFDPLAVIVAMTGVYWATAIWFTVRRGMT